EPLARKQRKTWGPRTHRALLFSRLRATEREQSLFSIRKPAVAESQLSHYEGASWKWSGRRSCQRQRYCFGSRAHVALAWLAIHRQGREGVWICVGFRCHPARLESCFLLSWPPRVGCGAGL